MRTPGVVGVSLALVSLVSVGCGSGGGKTTTPQTATQSVTPAAGGTVSLPDNSARLEIPPGAVAGTTMITVSTSDATPPAGVTAASPILKFEPDGIVFAKPVTVTFTFTNATRPIVYWSNSSGGFDPIAGTVSGSTISAQVTHFSSGFVADAPAAKDAAGNAIACGEGVACTTGATCGYGAGDVGAPTSSKDGTGTPTSGGSGGTSTGAPTGSGSAASDPGGARTSPLCASGADGTPTATGSGPAANDPAPASGGASGGGSSSGSSGTGTVDGGTTTCGATPPPTGASSSSMCCTCSVDGKFHCAPCSGSGATSDGSPTAKVDGGSGGTSNPPATSCTAGTACNPGQACGDIGMCCTCGADGHFQCGATCPNQAKPDGGAPIDQPGQPGQPDGGAGGPPAACEEGAACSPGTGCGGASTGGACSKCMCLASGMLHCTPCATGGGDDAGAPVGPPAVCEPGAACSPGTGCGGTGATCTKCMCMADGHLVCSPCATGGGDADAGAPGPNPVLPPAQCVPNGPCTAAQKCDNGLPAGAGCQKCFCGATGMLMCSAC
jgi:hypothetical protein